MIFEKLLPVLALLSITAFSLEEPPQEGWRLIVQKGEPKWYPPEVVSKMKDFMDITEHQDIIHTNQTSRQYPTTPVQQALVNALMAQSTPGRLSSTLFPLSFFRNRYYQGSYGVQSAQWIYDMASRYIADSGRTDVELTKFDHDWPQFSIVVRIEGTTGAQDRIIFGAHQDSINLEVPIEERPNARAPGADDDGSGSVVILEALRILLESGLRPERPIEFQWYAAEEVGLLGSQDIAQAYAQAQVPVHAMLQIDMCGGLPGTINPWGATIMTDYPPQILINFLVLMINTYTDLEYDFSTCGACSDHASWSREDYPAIFPIESEGYGGGHTAFDLPENMDYEYMWQYVWLVVGFGAELATV